MLLKLARLKLWFQKFPKLSVLMLVSRILGLHFVMLDSFTDNTDLLQTIYTLLFRIKHSCGIYRVIMESQFANTNKKTQFGIEGVLAVLDLKCSLMCPMTRNKYTMLKLGWRYKKTRSKKAYDALVATQQKVAGLFVGWKKTHLIASGVVAAAKHPQRADEDSTFITSLYQQPTNFLKNMMTISIRFSCGIAVYPLCRILKIVMIVPNHQSRKTPNYSLRRAQFDIFFCINIRESNIQN